MRPSILPDGPLGALPFSRLAALGLRCHIYLRTMQGEEEFSRRVASWSSMFETETRERGYDDATALPVLIRRTEDMYDMTNQEPGTDLVWLLAAFSVRSGASP